MTVSLFSALFYSLPAFHMHDTSHIHSSFLDFLSSRNDVHISFCICTIRVLPSFIDS